MLAIYVMITMLSLGVMNQENLAGLPNPSMAAIMEHIVGKWGAVLINLGDQDDGGYDKLCPVEYRTFFFTFPDSPEYENARRI